MKQALMMIGLFLISHALMAQTEKSGNMDKAAKGVSYSRDYLVIQFSYDGWARKPDSIQTKGLSRGFNFYLMYDFPIKQSKFSIGTGLGISTSSIFLKQTLNLADTAFRVKFSETNPYRKYKLATAYLELPIELRFRSHPDNANKGFKAALGIKIGNLVNAHTKGKRVAAANNVIEKEYSKRYFNTWRLSVTGRIGYGNLSLFGSYSLTPLFRDNTGLTIAPYSIGICVSGL